MEVFNNLLLNKSKSTDPPTQLLQHVHTWQQTLQSLNIDNTNQKSDSQSQDSSDSDNQHQGVKEEDNPEYQQWGVKGKDKIKHLVKLYSAGALSTNDSTDTNHFAWFP